MEYEHTQFGAQVFRFGLVALLLLVAVGAAAAGSGEGLVIIGLVALITGTALVIFGRLTVKVTDQHLVAHFGWGWPRRTLQWTDVTAVRAVRNRWWYGWGIRWFPGGLLWNVWGLDAVEFDLASGRALRIGTDEPEQLLAAVRRHTPAG